MPQFTVYKNKNASTKARIPYLLDVQSDLLSDLDTRVVIPLYTPTALKGKALATLTPTVEVEDKAYVLMTPQLAGISIKELGSEVADLTAHRDSIVAALDFLITGI
jgi:toxin CcdB